MENSWSHDTPLPVTRRRMQLTRGGDSPIGYPHRPPGLRLENRRTSISVDDVVKRTTLGSGASSPDSNLLRVQANLPGRRHSDNTIQLPRIQVTNSTSPPSGYSRRSSGPASSGPLPRRHSQGNPPGVQSYFQGITSSIASGYRVRAAAATADLSLTLYLLSLAPIAGQH